MFAVIASRLAIHSKGSAIREDEADSISLVPIVAETLVPARTSAITVPPPSYHLPHHEQGSEFLDYSGTIPAAGSSTSSLPIYTFAHPSDVERLPAYPGPTSPVPEEPAKLERFLFSFGFFFPPFWILGSVLLFSPLHNTPQWVLENNEGEQMQLLAEKRKQELKWGKRSLTALVITLVLMGLFAVIAILCKNRSP